MKLNQVNALVSGRKGEVEKFVGDLYKVVQKDDLFDGMSRTYKPLDDETGERLPTESKKVQGKVAVVLAEAREKWADLWDLVATQDAGNQHAQADIIIDGKRIAAGVPVTTLLFLEKQVNDLETFLSKLPTPDPSEEWTFDPNTDLLRTRETQTTRTKKVPRNHVKAEATDKFPAQVELLYEDVVVGYWNKTQYSGKVPMATKNQYLVRVKKLKDAVKTAREQANMADVDRARVAEGLLDFVLGQ